MECEPVAGLPGTPHCKKEFVILTSCYLLSGYNIAIIVKRYVMTTAYAKIHPTTI